MADVIILLLTIVTAITVGLVGGVFFAFSSFIMRALGALPPPTAISAMQSINVVVLRSLFLTAFFAAGLTSVILAVHAAFAWESHVALWQLAGGLVYVLGCVAVTVAANVPLNNTLAIVSPESAEGETVWTRYLSDWTLWNHIRTVACVISAICLTMALLVRP